MTTAFFVLYVLHTEFIYSMTGITRKNAVVSIACERHNALIVLLTFLNAYLELLTDSKVWYKHIHVIFRATGSSTYMEDMYIDSTPLKNGCSVAQLLIYRKLRSTVPMNDKPRVYTSPRIYVFEGGWGERQTQDEGRQQSTSCTVQKSYRTLLDGLMYACVLNIKKQGRYISFVRQDRTIHVPKKLPKRRLEETDIMHLNRAASLGEVVSRTTLFATRPRATTRPRLSQREQVTTSNAHCTTNEIPIVNQAQRWCVGYWTC